MGRATKFHRRTIGHCFLFVIAQAVSVLPGAEQGQAEKAGVFQANASRTGCADGKFPKRPAALCLFVPKPQEVFAGYEQPGSRVATKSEVPSLGGIVAHLGVLYSSDRAGRIYALDAADGHIRWQYEIGQSGGSGPPSVVGEMVYYASSVGVLALSRRNGALVWRHEIPEGASETSPLVMNGVVFVTGYDGVAYALDAEAGKVKWTRDIVKDAPPSPPEFDGERARLDKTRARPRIAASDGKTLFQPIFDQSRIVALDLGSGELRWSFQAKGWIYGNPVATDHHVLVGSQDDSFYCLDKGTGKVVWAFAAKARIEAGGAIDGKSVFFGSCDGTFYRVDIQTGRMVWSFQCDKDYRGYSPIYSSPLMDGEAVYFGGMEGQVYALNAADGKLIWKVRPSPLSQITGSLALDGGRIFLCTRPNWDDQGQNSIFAIGDADSP